MTIEIREGDCVEVMKTLPAACFDACVCDPPYALGFMGKTWDKFDVPAAIGAGRNFKAGATGTAHSHGIANNDNSSFQTWCEAWATEVLRVLKPGAHLLAFGGTRTFHRLACAIEDAGFEIRDTIMWVYGSGFPKSLDVSKAIDSAAGVTRKVVGIRASYRPAANAIRDPAGFQDRSDGRITEPSTDEAKRWAGWGTALKPAYEPVIVARKPLIGTVAANVLKHGTGALNIDACRIPTGDNLNGGAYSGGERPNSAMGCDPSAFKQPVGRWPANLILDDWQDPVLRLKQTLEVRASAIPLGWLTLFEPTGRSVRGGAGAMLDAQSGPTGQLGPALTGDEPSAASTGSVTGLRRRVKQDASAHRDSGGASRFFYQAKVSKSERGDSNHPTMKPIALMEYLLKLVVPFGGAVLDPFAGSGTTGIAAGNLGLHCLLIEKEEPYAAIARSRIGS